MPPKPFSGTDDFPATYFNLYQPKKDDSLDLGYTLASKPSMSREILLKVISDRISFLTKSIEDIQEQLLARQKLKESLISDIDTKLCQTKTALYELDSFGSLAERLNSRRKSSLESLFANLDQEKRQQELLHWQDAVLLQRELRQMERELLSAQRDLWMMRLLS